MICSWQDALDYFYGLANWETRSPGAAHDFELGRVADLLGQLGNPHHAWPAVHVGGTNGKGSTCAMVASILRAAGYAVGLYTSPHMHTLRERVRVDGDLVAEDFVIEWINAHRRVLDGHPGLTTFEGLTALGFSYFAARGVDVAVVEVGLGGRLDTTNTVRANLSVLTPIDLDHTAVLGATPEVIAADKAGILRPGVPVVLAPQAPAVEKVLLAAAEALGAPAVLVGRDVTWDEGETALGPIMDISLPGRLFPGATGGLTWPRRYKVECSLHGPYQRVNTAVAATVAAALDDTWQPVSRAAVEFGLLRTRWPGRLEQLPAASGHRTGTVVVDGAHNPHAARALAAALEDRYPGRRVVLLVGVSRGKDASGIMTALAPMAEEVVVTASRHPKALPAPDLAAVALPPGTHPHVADTVEEALEAALGLAGPADLVVATGSLFVAAAVRELWLAKLGIPMPPRDGPPVARRRPGRPR